jgi:DNA-binding CsgD family transcriptional regulator
MLWFAYDAAARIVVARDLTVLAANGNASRMIESHGLLALREGVLACRDRRSTTELTLIVTAAARTASFRVVGAEGGAAMLVEAFALGEGPADAVALSLRDLGAPVEIECADLESAFGVTPGEHQVLVQLLKGLSSREIAQESGKSILTVRTHVKRAYGKIGVKTRGQLFARLMPYLSIR